MAATSHDPESESQHLQEIPFHMGDGKAPVAPPDGLGATSLKSQGVSFGEHPMWRDDTTRHQQESWRPLEISLWCLLVDLIKPQRAPVNPFLCFVVFNYYQHLKKQPLLI